MVGQSVHMRDFGTFLLVPRKGEYHETRPVFRMDTPLRTALHGVREIPAAPELPSFYSTVWQSAGRPVFINPVAVARACRVDPEYVSDVLRDVLLAAADLMAEGFGVRLDFGLATVQFDPEARVLRTTFDAAFLKHLEKTGRKVREQSTHAVGVRQYFAAPRPISLLWKAPEEELNKARALVRRPSTAKGDGQGTHRQFTPVHATVRMAESPASDGTRGRAAPRPARERSLTPDFSVTVPAAANDNVHSRLYASPTTASRARDAAPRVQRPQSAASSRRSADSSMDRYGAAMAGLAAARTSRRPQSARASLRTGSSGSVYEF